MAKQGSCPAHRPGKPEVKVCFSRFDLDCRFAAGASVTALFTREELEGDKPGQIYYNR